MADKEVTQEEINQSSRDSKINDIENILNVEVDDQMDDEKIDDLYGLAHMSLDEKINNIIECMKTIHASDTDLKESLKLHIGFNDSEVNQILKEKLSEKKKSKIDELIDIL